MMDTPGVAEDIPRELRVASIRDSDSESEDLIDFDRKSSRVFRYQPGLWLTSALEVNLMSDMTNYPHEIREDIWASIINSLQGPHPLCFCKCKLVCSCDCPCLRCLERKLAEGFGFGGTYELKEETHPSELLPRYFWYKHELIRCHGPQAVCEVQTSPRDLPTEDIEEVDEDAAMLDVPLSSEVLTDGAVDITEDVVKGGLKKKPRVTVVAQDPQSIVPLHLEATEKKVDTFASTLKDLQFRLNRHGLLADPRSFLGKGRGEEKYDENDSLFDLEEDINLLEDDSDEDESDDSEDWNSDMDELYEEGEFLFVFDNLSEEEEEEAEPHPHKIPRGKREMAKFDFQKPTNLPMVFNPRAWKQAEKKGTIPDSLKLFYRTLEYVISGKRIQLLQKGVFDHFEFVDITMQRSVPIIRLNDLGRKEVLFVVQQILLTAFATFLMPYSPSVPGVGDNTPPKFFKYLRKDETCLVGGLINTSLADTTTLREILLRYVTPYTPDLQVCKKWWWLAVCEHVVRVVGDREEKLLNVFKDALAEATEQDVADFISDIETGNASERVSILLNDIILVDFVCVVNRRKQIIQHAIEDDCSQLLAPACMEFMVDDEKKDESQLTEFVTQVTLIPWQQTFNNTVNEMLTLLTGKNVILSVSATYRLIEKAIQQHNVADIFDEPPKTYAPSQTFLEFLRKDKDEEEYIAGLKRKRESTATDLAGVDEQLSTEKKGKRVKERIVVADILQTHSTRAIDLLHSSPVQLPQVFGVAIQCVNGNGYTGHIVLLRLHTFTSMTMIDLEYMGVDPALPPDIKVGANVGDHYMCLSAFLDILGSTARVNIEGRSRSLVYAGFDSKTKAFSLLSFPLASPSINPPADPMTKQDFLSSESTSVKGRLSFLDFITLHLWLQMVSDERQRTTLDTISVLANNGSTLESRMPPSLIKAVTACGDMVTRDWKSHLDRYTVAQLSYLKCWLSYLRKLQNPQTKYNVLFKGMFPHM